MIGHKRIPSREGGIEIVVEELSVRLAQQGHKVTAYNRKGHHVSGKEFETQKLKSYKGVTLKNVPSGFDKEHPQAEYLKFKSWYVEYPLKDEALQNADLFVTKAAGLFQIMKPFNDYLNRALAGFQMPSR